MGYHVQPDNGKTMQNVSDARAATRSKRLRAVASSSSMSQKPPALMALLLDPLEYLEAKRDIAPAFLSLIIPDL